MTRDIFEAYLSGGARNLYGGHFASAEDRRRAVLGAIRPLDADVADALEAQQAKLSPSAARAQHVAALRRGAAAVVTGQQAGLFLGPLYTVYKAATAVRLARALSEETGRTVVPLFWLQSEDHDLPEIAACRVVRTAGTPFTLALPVPGKNRVSVAHCTLPEQIGECLEALRNELANLPHAEEHLSRLARHYRHGAGWVQAFAGCLGELFADAGLLLLDPRDPLLARASIPLHRRALLEAEPISAALVARERLIKMEGWQSPVHVRQGAPLSFYHPEGPAGPRYRLSPAPGGFGEVGGERVYALDELLGSLQREPQRFSTSALLRPVLQDMLLPTAAYVGGPAEVAYFAQLPPLYAAYGLTLPLVVPRARLRIIESQTERLLGRTGLVADDLARPDAELIEKLPVCGRMQPSAETLERTLTEAFERSLRESLANVTGNGSEFRAAVDKMRSLVKTTASKLRYKYQKALLHRDRSLVEDVKRLKMLLYPGGGPQERFYGISYFAARYGEPVFIERVLDSVTPFDASGRDLRL